jgi:plastocyanin
VPIFHIVRRYFPAVTAAAIGLGAAGAQAETFTITQKDKTFSQSEITIAVGDSVEFKNIDDTAHSVLSTTPGLEFDLKTQKQGTSKAVTFDKPGRIEVGCDIHPKMHLIINVK